MLAAAGMIVTDQWGYHPLFNGKLSTNRCWRSRRCRSSGCRSTFIMFVEVLGILNSRRPDYEPGNFLGSSQWRPPTRGTTTSSASSTTAASRCSARSVC